MYYCVKLDQFPVITHHYRVVRNTVWEITDKDNILIFIEDGCCSITYEAKQYTLKKGDVFFIPKNHAYCRRPIDGAMCTMTYIHFSLSNEFVSVELPELTKTITAERNRLDQKILENAPHLFEQYTLYFQNQIRLEDDSKVFQSLAEIQLFSTGRHLMRDFQSSIALCSILSRLSQDTIHKVSSDNLLASDNKIPTNLKKSILYIRSHYTEPISLSDLAAYCNLSKQQIIRYFKSAFQKTPTVYINEYKVNRAKELLFNQPHLTIKEIAGELGFESQHYFARVFLKTTGETPSHYRDRTIHFPVSSHLPE